MPRHRDYRVAGDVVSRVAASVSKTSSPLESLVTLLSSLHGAVPGLSAWILRRPGRGGSLPAGWIPSPAPAPFPESLLAQPGSAAAEVLATGHRLALGVEPASVAKHPEGPWMRRRGGAWLLLPVVSPDPQGVLVATHSEPAALGALLAPLESIARAAGPALGLLIERIETERRVEERTHELALFYEVSRSLALAKSADEIASILGHHLGPALELEALALIVVRPDRHAMYIDASGGTTASSLLQFRRAAVREAVATLGAGIRPLSVRVNRPARLSRGRAGARGTDVHAPLGMRDRAGGLLSVRTASPAVGESRLRLLYTIANQAALALERVRAVEESLQLRIRSVLDSMREGVLLVDRSLGVTVANPAAQILCREILGGPPPRRLRRLGGVDLAPILESLAATSEGPGTPPTAIDVRGGDSERVFQLTASAARGPKGVFEGAVLVLSDVTERNRMQDQLLQSEKLSSLGEMISGVAHELNNPLASIMGYAQLLENRDVPDDVHRKVASINREASRCHRIVQNLLRFARKQPPEKRATDLNSVVGSVVQLLGYQLQSDNIIMDVDLDTNMRTVLGDFHALQQVFVNIVHNAHQAMRGSGGQGLLRIVTRCDGATARVEISDNGPGIRAEHLKRIFDPFFSTKPVGQGTGLGLSIAYGTVKDHGGEISARSRPGLGSTFLVELPVRALAEPEAPRLEAAAVAPQPLAAGGRILVVDDEPSLAMMICEALAAEGHEVEFVPDGISARRRLEEGRYDLIISDLKMPNMGGRELYEALLESDPSMARRIVFSTGDSVSADTQEFFRRIGKPYLTKPFNLSELYRIVNSALRSA